MEVEDDINNVSKESIDVGRIISLFPFNFICPHICLFLQTTVTLEDLLSKNGAERSLIQEVVVVMATTTDDDPPMVADWFLDNLWRVLNNEALQVNAPPQLPPGFVLPAPLTIRGLKEAILRSIRGPEVPPPALIDRTFGLECTGAQIGHVGAHIGTSCFHPWWIYQDQQSLVTYNVSICPIAQFWVSHPRSNNMSRTAICVAFPPAVPLFV